MKLREYRIGAVFESSCQVNTNGKGQKSRDKSLQRNQKIYDNAEAINKDNSQKFARKLGREEKRIEQRKKRQAKRKNRK